MIGFFAIIAAMTLVIFFLVSDKLGRKSDVDRVIDFLEELIEMDAIKIEIGSNNSKALAKTETSLAKSAPESISDMLGGE